MKVEIDMDELYPFFTVWPSEDGIEMPQDLQEAYERNLKEFKQIQSQISKLYKEQHAIQTQE